MPLTKLRSWFKQVLGLTRRTFLREPCCGLALTGSGCSIAIPASSRRDSPNRIVVIGSPNPGVVSSDFPPPASSGVNRDTLFAPVLKGAPSWKGTSKSVHTVDRPWAESSMEFRSSIARMVRPFTSYCSPDPTLAPTFREVFTRSKSWDVCIRQRSN
jgi:hypothetical protein